MPPGSLAGFTYKIIYVITTNSLNSLPLVDPPERKEDPFDSIAFVTYKCLIKLNKQLECTVVIRCKKLLYGS